MREYIVHTTTGRYISYHADTAEDAIRYARYDAHKAMMALTWDEHQQWVTENLYGALSTEYPDQQMILNAEIDQQIEWEAAS